jgi:hypothetical protein
MVLAIMTGRDLSWGWVPSRLRRNGRDDCGGRQFLLPSLVDAHLAGLALLVVGVAFSLIGDGLAERR